MTIERAADALNIHRTTLGRIEAGLLPYSQGILEAAAELYGCKPSEILDVDPTKAGEVVHLADILDQATAEQKAEIIGYAKGRIGIH